MKYLKYILPLVVILAVIVIILLKVNQKPLPATPTTLVEPVTQLVYPYGFTTEYSDEKYKKEYPDHIRIVSFVKDKSFIEISEKFTDDPTCEKFYKAENFGFCVKGYHGEASSDELATQFINLNK